MRARSTTGRPCRCLGRRLKALGIQPRLARNASRMDIASDLPAYVFSRLLGFSQSTADSWETEASGFIRAVTGAAAP